MSGSKSPSALPVIPAHVPTCDNSGMDQFNRCPRLFYLSTRQNLKSTRGGVATSYGTLMHKGLQTWYKGFDAEATLTAMFEHPYEDPIGDFRTKARALQTMTEYVLHYGEDPQWEILMTETPFTLVDPEDGFRWGGKIDLLVRWHNKIWVVDHKTTSVFGDTYFDPFFPDTQTAGYIYAASLMHGVKVHGAILNVIIGHKVKKSGDLQFQRRAFNYDDWMIDEFKRQSIDGYHDIGAAMDLQQKIEQAGGDPYDAWRPRWRSCTEKYGRCTFYENCRLRPENRGRVLHRSGDFIVKPWDWMEVDD